MARAQTILTPGRLLTAGLISIPMVAGAANVPLRDVLNGASGTVNLSAANTYTNGFVISNNLTIEGNGATIDLNAEPAVNPKTIVASGAITVTIRNCIIKDAPDEAGSAQSGATLRLENCTVTATQRGFVARSGGDLAVTGGSYTVGYSALESQGAGSTLTATNVTASSTGPYVYQSTGGSVTASGGTVSGGTSATIEVSGATTNLSGNLVLDGPTAIGLYAHAGGSLTINNIDVLNAKAQFGSVNINGTNGSIQNLLVNRGATATAVPSAPLANTTGVIIHNTTLSNFTGVDVRGAATAIDANTASFGSAITNLNIEAADLGFSVIASPFTINGGRIANAAPTGINASSNITLRNMEFENCGQFGVNLQAGINLTLASSTFTDCAQNNNDAIVWINGGTCTATGPLVFHNSGPLRQFTTVFRMAGGNLTFEGNYESLFRGYGYPVLMTGGASTTMRKTMFLDCGEGVYSDNSTSLVEDCTFMNMYVGQALPTVLTSQSATFRRNEVYKTTESGVGGDTQSGDLLVEDNYFEDLTNAGVTTRVGDAGGSAIARRNTVRRSGNPAAFEIGGHNIQVYLNGAFNSKVYGMQVLNTTPDYEFERNFVSGSVDKMALIRSTTSGHLNFNVFHRNFDEALITDGVHEIIGNIFFNNGVPANGDFAIFADPDAGAGAASASAIQQNTFLTSPYGVWIDQLPIVDGTNNFWGSALGASVGQTKNVLTIPFLLEPASSYGFVDGIQVKGSQTTVCNYADGGMGVVGLLYSPQTFNTVAASAVWTSKNNPTPVTNFTPVNGANRLFATAVNDARFTIRKGMITLVFSSTALNQGGLSATTCRPYYFNDNTNAWQAIPGVVKNGEHWVTLPRHSATIALAPGNSVSAFLLGSVANPGGLDLNGDGSVSVADAVRE